MQNYRTIKVTGRGRLRLRPDTTRITATLAGVYKDYAEALEKSAGSTGEVCDALARCGFDRDDVKTVDFSVDTEYEGYEENGVYKQRLRGYRYSHTVKFEFVPDNERLGRIISALSGCESSPQFSISYTVSDKESVKKELLRQAVADAEEKAKVIAGAAGVRLGVICGINHASGDLDLETVPIRAISAKMRVNDASGAGFGMNVTPDDIEVTDSVSVIRYIE